MPRRVWFYRICAAERSGFVREGTLRSWLEIGGQRKDMYMYSRLPTRKEIPLSEPVCSGAVSVSRFLISGTAKSGTLASNCWNQLLQRSLDPTVMFFDQALPGESTA